MDSVSLAVSMKSWLRSKGVWLAGTAVLALTCALTVATSAEAARFATCFAQKPTPGVTVDSSTLTITGTEGDDVIIAASSENWTIDGLGGNDSICGSGGDDIIHGGPGDDQIDGESGDDQVFGDAGNDIVAGGAGEDEVFGGDGNDRLFGSGGNDFLDGGFGTDGVSGGNGFDACVNEEFTLPFPKAECEA